MDLLEIDDFIVPVDKELNDLAEDMTSHIMTTTDTVHTKPPDDIAIEVPHTQVIYNSAFSDADKLISYAEQQHTS